MRWLKYGKTVQISRQITFEPTGAVTRASGLHPGGHGFDFRPSHIKDFKIGITARSFALSIEKAELVSPVSVYCDRVECHAICLRCDMPVRRTL